MKKVTMTQIATELGISRTLVSFALTDKYGVSEETKKKIVTKAVELGYYKTLHAKKNNKMNVAIVIGEEFLGEKSFFSRIIAGIESASLKYKWNTKIFSYSKGYDVNDFITSLIDIKPQGIIVLRSLDKKMAEMFNNINVPIVFVDLIDAVSDVFEVRINNIANMYSLTEFVIRKNSKNIHFIGDINWALSFRERYQGFKMACLDNNIKYAEVIGKDENGEYPFDINKVKQILKAEEEITMVCVSDSVASYIYKEVEKTGKKIGDKIKIVGFDDEDETKDFNPPLTTMHIPKYELGYASCELLYNQINNNEYRNRVICLNAYLVERKSI